MADATVNGLTVLQADLLRPWSGRWTARVELDGGVSVGDRAALRLLGVDYAGTVREAGVIGGRGYALIVAGAAGLDRALGPQHYAGGVSVRLLLQDMLESLGEALAVTSAPDVLARVLPAWTRPAGVALDALDALADYLGTTWRSLPDGTVWVGSDTWTPTADEWRLTAGDPGAGRLTLAADVATFGPGDALDSASAYRIRSVKHCVTPASARSIVRLAV